ncbi:MAG: zinc ribbon domain-containing protein [Candidatus Woesearchaeota archaeon]
MQIPPIVFIIVGIMVSLISYLIYLKEGTMALFIYIGLAMLLYGIVRMILLKIKREREKLEKNMMDYFVGDQNPFYSQQNKIVLMAQQMNEKINQQNVYSLKTLNPQYQQYYRNRRIDHPNLRTANLHTTSNSVLNTPSVHSGGHAYPGTHNPAYPSSSHSYTSSPHHSHNTHSSHNLSGHRHSQHPYVRYLGGESNRTHTHHSYVVCRRCRSHNSLNSNFCHNCGHRLR